MAAAFFSTSTYEATFGKKPRGRDCWKFMADTSDDFIITGPMNYSEAKKLAMRLHPKASTFIVCA